MCADNEKNQNTSRRFFVGKNGCGCGDWLFLLAAASVIFVLFFGASIMNFVCIFVVALRILCFFWSYSNEFWYVFCHCIHTFCVNFLWCIHAFCRLKTWVNADVQIAHSRYNNDLINICMNVDDKYTVNACWACTISSQTRTLPLYPLVWCRFECTCTCIQVCPVCDISACVETSHSFAPNF